MLCASPARPPRMPRRSVSCGNAQAVIDEEIHVEAARRWLPVDKDQQRVCVGDKSVHKQNFIHSRLSEHEDPVQMKEKQAELVKQYDLNKMHLPLHEPFLGSMYWTPATPLPSRTFSRQASSPSVMTTSSIFTSPMKNTVEIAQVTPSPGFGLKNAKNMIDTSTDSTADFTRSEDDINLSMNSNNITSRMNVGKVNTSCELLDYSVLDEDIIEGLPQTPARRLFEEEEMVTPSKLMNSFVIEEDEEEEKEESNVIEANDDEFETIPSPAYVCRDGLDSKLKKQHMTTECLSEINFSPIMSEINMEVSQINYSTTQVHGPITPPKPHPPSPNIATFYGHWGSRRERHVSTLPSQITGKPIRLRITETRPTDMFSYDPYYSSGTYVITTENNRPYGNGLLMRMGTQFMSLEDGRGCTLAVIKSRYTHVPSSVIYAPKPRFAGQAPSGHRLSNLTGSSEYCSQSSELYPWALVRKEGRTMNDSCTIHLVDETILRTNTNGLSRRNSGLFGTMPNFRGNHSFEGEWNTHTLVRRSVVYEGKTVDEPCCVIVRDPTNVDAVDITIAPGIDPLLMVCYLASHSKMDVEPIMGGF